MSVVWTFLAVLGVSASGCLVMQQLGWGGAAEGFSHKLHVVDEELECADCHMYYEDREDPGLPRLKACMLCHEDIDEDLPASKRAETFYVDGKFNAARVNLLDPEIKFSHMEHVTDEEGCIDCHSEIVSSVGRPSTWMGLQMDGCVECHEQTGYATDCTTCHEELTADTPPASHDSAWYRQHGLSMRGGAFPGQTADRCDICHSESSCVACHRDEPPVNHNNFWRRRGHGLTARMDRDNCAACHQPDYCDRCHTTAVPQSHNSIWGGSKSTHCLGCHETGSDNSCQLCHTAGAPSHFLAPGQPIGHDPASDCRSCHLILTHVDNGDDCNQCHF